MLTPMQWAYGFGIFGAIAGGFLIMALVELIWPGVETNED